MESTAHPVSGDPDEATSPGSEDTGFDVFLSHNSKDKEEVRLLADALRQRGLRPWLDEEHLTPGRSWQEEIDIVLGTIPAAAVLIGANGLGAWEKPELQASLSEMVERKIPVIPVLLPSAPQNPDLPRFLRNITWVDFRGGFTEKGLDRLVRGITGKHQERKSSGEPAKAPHSTDNPALWLVINCFLITALAIAFWAWCRIFTDWPITTFLGVTAAPGLSVLGLALKALFSTEPGQSLWQKIGTFFLQILQSRRAGLVPAGLFLVGSLLMTCIGSVRLDATRDPERISRNVKLYSREDGSSPQSIRGSLLPKQHAKFPLWTPPFGTRSYWIEVSDLPPLLREVHAREVLELEVPDTFFSRPAILVRPAPRVSNTVYQAPDMFELRVTIGKETFLSPYDGRTVWIGVPAIAVPTRLHKAWRAEVNDLNVEQRWFGPKAVAPRKLLSPGEWVTVEILKKECSPYRPPLPRECRPYVSITRKVLRSESPFQFPQVLELDED